MTRKPRPRGFTLVELLVVIAIIVVLMAILFPVFSRVRERARKTKCQANLHQLAMALKQYREDHGRYPSAPWYDDTIGRYRGGFSDLYPDYIDNTEVLLCPDDLEAKGLGAKISQNIYSSYNGQATNPRGDNWALQEVYYNYNGYDFSGAPGSAVNSTGVDNGGGADDLYFAVLLPEFGPKGLRPNRDAPRLANRSAPGFTIITHCRFHRGRGDPSDQNEIVARADGTVDGAVKRAYLEQDPDGTGPKVAPYVSQLK